MQPLQLISSGWLGLQLGWGRQSLRFAWHEARWLGRILLYLHEISLVGGWGSPPLHMHFLSSLHYGLPLAARQDAGW